ncbi:MAG: CrcB family protein, partial [Deltaproteobacteria bacterium]|nr:CrcB family protein [Deltaproteobacteria bacterium]
GTLTVNVMGCFFIGFGGGLMESRQLFTPEARLFVFTGLLGGFTTFSTFGYESFNLARDGQMIGVLLNIGLHLLLGLAAVWAGNLLSRFV